VKETRVQQAHLEFLVKVVCLEGLGIPENKENKEKLETPAS